MQDVNTTRAQLLSRGWCGVLHAAQPLFILVVVGLLLLGTHAVAAANALARPPQQTEQTKIVTITANRLNVRSGPGTDHAVIAKLLLGNQVQVDRANDGGDWYQVTLADGQQGWIAVAFTTSIDGPAQFNATLVPFDASASNDNGNPEPEREITEEITEALVATVAEAETVVAEVTVPTAYTAPPNMNIRRGPGTNYPVATSVPAGTALTILARNPAGDWYQIQLVGQADPVWVYAPLTTAAGPVATLPTLSPDQLPPAPAPAPEPVAVAPAAPAINSAPPAGAGFFGYGIQVNTWQGDKGGSAGMVRDIGFNWVKQQVRWEFVENEPGAVNWSEMDQIIDVMHGNGINVLFSVVTAPQWTRPDKPGTGGPPNDFNLFANFVGAMAGRYCGRLAAIEVWNEQNLQREWEGFPLDPALYMDLLRRAHGAIKAACPAIIVISGATTPTGDSPVAVDDISYLRGMYNHGLANHSDGIGIHPSGYGQPPGVTFQQWQAGQYDAPSHVSHRSFYFRSTMEESRQVMIQYGDVNKRLWPTEFGWASSQSPHPGYEYSAYNTPQEQAQFTVEAYNMMRDWGWVGVAFLWNLNYTHGEMGQWSIIGKPAYEALKQMPK